MAEFGYIQRGDVMGKKREYKDYTPKTITVEKTVTDATSGVSNMSKASFETAARTMNPAQLAAMASKTLEAVTDDENNTKFYVYDTATELEEYQVTVVTYETKDFAEYIYVNKEQDPSSASKIIEGSVASGDVTYYENYENIRVSEAEYRKALKKKAEEYLKTYVVCEKVEVTPYKLSNKVYNEDYKVGDIVTAYNDLQGFAADFRITAVNEVWDSKGYSVEITLGDDVPTLTNRIKLLSKNG